MRFVVLHHTDVDEPHFDIMVESAPDSPLMTWRSPVWPITSRTALARLPDHRRAYLEYQGPISGKRGSVRRVDAGGCTIDSAGTVWLAKITIQQHAGEWIAMKK